MNDLSKKHRCIKRCRDETTEDYVFASGESALSNNKQCVVVVALLLIMPCSNCRIGTYTHIHYPALAPIKLLLVERIYEKPKKVHMSL